MKNDRGERVAGLFDPKTNTIQLDSELGNLHTLMHEATHAGTSHVLENKSHPVTKQLTELYNTVKDSLESAYGARSLDEFVAEAMSNPEFQTTLNRINPKGEKITAWQRFSNTIRNFLRSLMGMPTKPLGSALDATDTMVNQILSTAPDIRNAGALYAMSLTGDAGKVLDTIGKRAANLPGLNQDRVNLS